MTLLVRNEVDIIDAQIAFHLNAGIDLVVATDNGSDDGTTAILRRYEREGYLHYAMRAEPLSQVETVTGMARKAATDFGADWVINSDGDEFWWPRAGSLKDVFAAVPPPFGCVRGMLRNFVPRDSATEFFAERMTVRAHPVTGGSHPFNPHFKTAHRADPMVSVGGGNHDATGRALAPIPSWYPIDVLHFPIRSREQYKQKYLRWWWLTSVDGVSSNPYYNLVHETHLQGRIDELYDSYVIDEDALARGLDVGTLAVDTRLRDALRSLRTTERGTPHFRLNSPLRLPAQAIDHEYVSALAALEEYSEINQARDRVETFERRLSMLDGTVASRLHSGVRVRSGSGCLR